MRKIAIIVAAGIGNRMQSEKPKQFLPLAGKLVLMHSIEKFHQIGAEIIITLHPDYQEFWRNACIAHQFYVPHRIILGGKERFHSIQNAIRSIQTTENCLVAIHDAARPNVSIQLIERLYDCAQKFKNAIPGIQPTDTLRSVNQNNLLNRNDFWCVQTPQIFDLQLLKESYEQDYCEIFTDDASVVEASGAVIKVIEGDKYNFKITFPEDLQFMEILFAVN